MGDVDYDLDTTGGLMDQIQALLAPPTNEQTPPKNGKETSKHPYYKRPGKGHNHDSCDACTEGGDLICCDKCPASFHLQCHDPPLEEADIPQGQWLCHMCRKNAEIKVNKITNSNEESENSRKRLRRQASSASTSTPEVTNAAQNVSSSTSSSRSPNKKQKPNPLEVLVQAASVLNPKQFELPKALTVPCPFPGTDKIEILTNRNGRRQPPRSNGKQVRKPHELQPGGIVPLPARTCFECGRSCRVAPLLACDYCPLFFHQDCLDPPLTAPPNGRWMCPNHVEQYIDSKLVTTVSATERIKLWDRFTGPIDQDAIKTEFIRKAHCRNPPFRIKVNLGTRSRVKVPGLVRYHYKHPVDLLPSLRDVRRAQCVLQRTEDPFYFDNRSDDFYYDEVDDLMNSDRTGNCQNNKIETSSQDSGIVDYEHGIDSNNSADIKQPPSTNATQWNGRRSSNCSNGSNDDTSSQILAALGHDIKLPDVVSNISQDVDRELKQLDDRLVRFLAYQRLQQLSKSDLPDINKQKPHKHMPLPSELLTPADIERISRVFLSPTKCKSPTPPPPPPAPPIVPTNTTLSSESITTSIQTVDLSDVDTRIRARAILYPVITKNIIETVETIDEKLSQATAMRYRSLSIGRGPANHVDIDRYGKCNFVSAKHAVIFYDEAAQKYELINYSEHGTSVNNVLYTCDFSTKRTKQQSLIADIVEKRKTAKMAADSSSSCSSTPVHNNNNNNHNNISSTKLTCRCGHGVPPELTEGWEGTAILSHGTLLKFGCISFVFSITDETGV
ncbi:PHD finger protein 12 [Chrysoperla carnea]|uniref:PHD finger protein 12 n=1 Tax=Chrysoperla carnea TaxID=189513 RepID=UPI001D08C132|nr:PHD finger protein 12 [Chrysoperla carnea]